MYAGKPIIQAVEAGNDLVTDASCGLTVPPEDPEAMVHAIDTLYNMTEVEREILGNNGKKYVLKNHTYGALAKQFMDAIL
jgi:glycosyltransferase involved in cell wall biosynthesis